MLRLPPPFFDTLKQIIFIIFQYSINPDFYGGEENVLRIIRYHSFGLGHVMTPNEIEGFNNYIELMLHLYAPTPSEQQQRQHHDHDYKYR